jgi:hypothetical protein
VCVTIFWLQIIDDVSVQNTGKIKLRGVHGGRMWRTVDAKSKNFHAAVTMVEI